MSKYSFAVINKTNHPVGILCTSSLAILEPGVPFYLDRDEFPDFVRRQLTNDGLIYFYIIKHNMTDNESSLCGHLIVIAIIMGCSKTFNVEGQAYISNAIIYAYLPLPNGEKPIISGRLLVAPDNKWYDVCFDVEVMEFDYAGIEASNIEELGGIINKYLSESMNGLVGA